jgi:NADH:ubiquinone oxidoreductase subunit E/ActR/RegA family two-component response regulator
MNPLTSVSESSLEEWPQILILEDEPSVAEGLKMVLNEGGYNAEFELTGKGALKTFAEKTHDLLIADLRLPDIDGMDVIKQVKQNHPSTGVIVITGYSTVSSAVEAMKIGVHDYLPKPFTEDDIMSAVRSALEISREPEKEGTGLDLIESPPFSKIGLVLENQARVDAVMSEVKKKFTGKSDEVIPMLQFVQKHLGYLPENALEAIARLTGRSTASVFGVATFYEQFRLLPAGRHVVRVCRGTACHVKGAERILSEISSKFQLSPGQTSDDRLLTLETVACFGSCAIAPVVVVDTHVKGRMNPSKICSTLDQIRQDASEDVLQKPLGQGEQNGLCNHKVQGR